MPHVLVVDDDPEILKILVRRFARVKSEPWIVSQARSYAGAVALLSLRPDVVVTDLEMDTSDAGVEVFKAVRIRWPFVAVVLYTGLGPPAEVPFDAYVPKPNSTGQLVDVARSFRFGRHRRDPIDQA